MFFIKNNMFWIATALLIFTACQPINLPLPTPDTANPMASVTQNAQPTDTPELQPTQPIQPQAEVAVDNLSLRACTAGNCAEVAQLSRGIEIAVIGCLADDTWCQIALSDGTTGWTGKGALTFQPGGISIPILAAILPTSTPQPEVIPTEFSKIAFMSRLRADDDAWNFEIYTMDADGRNLTRITNHPSREEAPALSFDGQKIVFQTDRDDMDNCRATGSTTCNLEIYTMDANGANVTRLTNHPAQDTEAAWSPDGSKIVFISDRDAEDRLTGNIYIMNADGGDVTRLTDFRWEYSKPGSPRQPVWSPDGKQLAFVAQHLISDGGQEIYVINSDGSDLTRLTTSQGDDFGPAWSPDGREIAFASYRNAYGTPDIGNTEIYVMRADGSNPRRLTNNPTRTPNFPGADEDPVWSPDGSKIAFRSYRDGQPHIYVMNADGSGVTQLTFGEGADYGPVWSRK